MKTILYLHTKIVLHSKVLPDLATRADPNEIQHADLYQRQVSNTLQDGLYLIVAYVYVHPA